MQLPRAFQNAGPSRRGENRAAGQEHGDADGRGGAGALLEPDGRPQVARDMGGLEEQVPSAGGVLSFRMEHGLNGLLRIYKDRAEILE